tara:strand:- start:11 stop:367 length:357 start_codon:yes stop_codon:yes gene_type:complete
MSQNYVALGGSDYDIEDYTLPSERTFREAWDTPSGSVISVNMDKAKDIWRDKIREDRVPEFEKLDSAFMKALETGASTTQIVADKQVLRDATVHSGIDAATTPDQLKEVQPIPNVTIT